jgi:hypothetical protein
MKTIGGGSVPQPGKLGFRKLKHFFFFFKFSSKNERMANKFFFVSICCRWHGNPHLFRNCKSQVPILLVAGLKTLEGVFKELKNSHA